MRRYMRAAKAAEELGVSGELISGLIRGGQVDGFHIGPTEQPVWFVYDDEVGRLKAMTLREVKA